MKYVFTLSTVLVLTFFFLVQMKLKSENSKSYKEPEGNRLRTIVKENFKDKNVFIGATSTLFEGNIGKLLADEFSYITPANDFKQTRIHPEPGKWNWEKADSWVEFSKQHNQVIRIHGPISPQCSKWAKDDSRTSEELEINLEEYMTALCKRYNGVENILWMDVINETVNPDGTWKKAKPGLLWEMPWEKIGYQKTPSKYENLDGKIPKYILNAFRIATKHAPDKKLIINQHAGMDEAAWKKIKDMVMYLRSLGYRVDGIGWQAHIKLIKDDPSQWETGSVNNEELSNLIKWAHENKLDFHVTENNIHVKPEDENNNEEHADVFVGILNTLLENRETGVVTWNIWDLHDVNHWMSLSGKVKIGLWDRELVPKEAYYEVQKLLENPPNDKK